MISLDDFIPRVGESVGRYRLEQVLGRGGFGVVFRAIQDVANVEVALKVMIPQLSTADESQQWLARFEQETSILKRLHHPSTIRLLDHGTTARGLPFMVLEFARGRPLTDLIGEARFRPEQVVRIATQVLGALEEAHATGVVHRDLKPDNLMMLDVIGTEDAVKVLDFGIAKLWAEDSSVNTRTGTAVGTPRYMAPEQVGDFKQVDGRADLYALGLIMVECLTGAPVVASDSQQQQILAQIGPEPHALDPYVQQLPLYPVLERALAKDPDSRFASAREMREALRAVATHHSVVPTRPVADPHPVQTRPPQQSAPVAAAVAVSQARTLSGVGELAPVSQSIPTPSAESSTRPAPAPSGPSRWLLLPALGVFVLAVVALLVFVLPGGGDGDAPHSVGDAPDGFALIPAGEFPMGSPNGEAGRGSDERYRQVSITYPFYLQTHEVTQAEWADVVGNHPSRAPHCGDDCPVENVNWYEALWYANALSVGQGLPECYNLTNCDSGPGQGMQCESVLFTGLDCQGYRLPSEAEWEFAARAETTTAWHCGNAVGCLSRVAYYQGNSNGRTHPVAEMAANDWGLTDMSGNVSEWVWDAYGTPSPDNLVNPVAQESGLRRVVRGGSFNSQPGATRSASRESVPARDRRATRGFRLARTVY